MIIFLLGIIESQSAYSSRNYQDAEYANNRCIKVFEDESTHNDLRSIVDDLELLKKILGYNQYVILAKLGRYKDSLTGLEKLNIPGYNHLVHFQKGYIFGLAGFHNTSLDSFKSA